MWGALLLRTCCDGGAGRRRLPSSPVKPCCVCVCVCVCVVAVSVCVWGWGGGQISPSGDQDDASCGGGATRSAPVGEHLRQESRLGLAAHQTGMGGAASFVKVAVASCRATKAAASAAGIAQASSSQHMREWTVAGEDLGMRSACVPQLARRPSDEICSCATPGQDRAGDLQRVRLTS